MHDQGKMRGDANRAAAMKNMIFGLVWCIGGAIVTLGSYSMAAPGGTYVVTSGAFVFGGIQFLRGAVQLPSAHFPSQRSTGCWPTVLACSTLMTAILAAILGVTAVFAFGREAPDAETARMLFAWGAVPSLGVSLVLVIALLVVAALTSENDS